MRLLDLFSGIGGFSLAARWMNWETVAFVEKEPYCQKVLRKNFSQDIEIYDDITTFSGEPFRGRIDIITGGFPCQDVSIAGKRKGLDGDRSGLWSEQVRILSEVRPQFVVVENTTGLLSCGMGTVLADLSRLGYDAEWRTFYAHEAGYPHQRARVFILAYTAGERCEYSVNGASQGNPSPRFLDQISITGDVVSFERQFREEIRSTAFIRTANGIPDRVDRIKALGNAIVPQIAFEIFKAIETPDTDYCSEHRQS